METVAGIHAGVPQFLSYTKHGTKMEDLFRHVACSELNESDNTIFKYYSRINLGVKM